MQEALKKVISDTAESIAKTVTLCIRSQQTELSGVWNWDMNSSAVYCSDVMSFPDEFAGTKGIVHPDDLFKLMAALTLLEEKEISRLDFRIITTYGEVKNISGQRISIEDPKIKNLTDLIPGKEPWEEALQQLSLQKEADYFHLRGEIADYTERLNNIGSWLINKNNAEAWYSDNVFRIFGLAPQSLNAHINTFNPFIHPDDRIAVLDAFEKAYEEEVPLHIEYRIVLPDGESKYVQQITKWICSNKGHLVFAGILRDVTEERKIADELFAAQSATLLNQQLLRLSEQKSATGHWHISLITRKANFSDNYYRIYGVKQNALPLYNSFLNLVHPEDSNKARDAIDQMYREHALPEMEFRIIRPDGKTRILRQTGRPFIAPNKEMIMIGIVQDVTVQKSLENKIAGLNDIINLNRLVTEMTESVADVSSITWLPNGYMRWSDGFYQLLGYRPGSVEPISGLLHKSIHSEDLMLFKNAESLVTDGQPHEDILVRIVSKRGMRFIKFSFRRFSNEKEEGIAIGLAHDVTRQKPLHEELSNSKSFGELVINSVNDIIIFTNTDNVILHWNEEAEKSMNITKEDALQNNLFDVLPGLNEENFLGQLHFALRGNEAQPRRVANTYIHKMHNYRLCPLKNEKGEVLGIVHVVQDVSEQLMLQQQLSERLNFIESLVEFSVDRIVVLDRFMNYIYWNKKAEDYYGISKEKVLGRNILEVFPSFRNNPGYNEFRKVLNGETVHLPATLYEESSEYAEIYLIPIKDETGDVTAVLWIVHDLTPQKKTEQELIRLKDAIAQNANDRYYTLFNSIDEGFAIIELIFDDTGKPVDFIYRENNPAFIKHVGIDLQGKMRSELFSDQKDFLLEKYEHLFKTGEALHFEYYVQSLGGQWFEVTACKIGGKESNQLGVIFRNITERKRSGQQQEYLLRLGDALRPLANAVEIKRAAMQILGEHLNVDRVIYADVDGEGFVLNDNYVSEGTQKLTGRLPFDAFGASVKKLRNGQAVIVDDVSLCDYDDTEKQNFFAIGVHAVAAVPLIKNGQLVANLSIHHQMPRHWRSDEVLLIQETAERTWAAVERAKAEQALCCSEERLQKTISIQTVGVLFFNLNGSMTGCNNAFERMIGYTHEELRRVDWQVLTPDEFMEVTTKAAAELSVTGESAPYEKEMVRKDGSRFWALCAPRRLKGEGKDSECVEFIVDITARKAVEEKLTNFNSQLEQEITERTRELQKQLTLLRYTEYLAQSGTWDYEVATGNFKWSEGMYKLFGLSQQRKVRPEIYLRHAIEQDLHIAKKIVALLQTQHDPFEEILRIKRNGEVRTIKVKGSVIADENGKAQRIIGADVDITNIQKAEDELKQSRHWLEQTAKTSPDSITIYDIEKKQPIYLNNCLAEWLGMSSNDLLEMGFEERLKLIYPDDRLNLLQNNEKTVTAKDNVTIGMEYRLKTTDGKTIWVRNRSKPFQRNASGKVTHILSILQNVTEEVELREELKQRTQYAESIIDASIDRIAVYDKELRIIAWNRRSEEVTGRKKQNVLGQKLFDVFPKVGQDEELLKAHLDALKGSYVSVPAKRGTYTNNYYERFFIPLKNERKETYAIVCIMHDVSELVNRNAELHELNQSQEQKNEELEQKNEEITSFAFVASHDMKEPLRKIHTFSDWLIGQEAELLSEKGKSMLEKMNTSVHRMEALIDDILALTKIHSDTRREEEVNLNKILRQVFDNMFEQISLTQTGVHADQLPVIKGNSNQIFYLFHNLISNAIKFQKPGNVPQIKITAEVISGEGTGLANPYEEYAKISFSDNGFGFDQRYAKKIFQVFQRLHGRHEFEGTGIGLAICKKIMENHEGMITVESEQGKGSVFSCYFPLF